MKMNIVNTVLMNSFDTRTTLDSPSLFNTKDRLLKLNFIMLIIGIVFLWLELLSPNPFIWSIITDITLIWITGTGIILVYFDKSKFASELIGYLYFIAIPARVCWDYFIDIPGNLEMLYATVLLLIIPSYVLYLVKEKRTHIYIHVILSNIILGIDYVILLNRLETIPDSSLVTGLIAFSFLNVAIYLGLKISKFHLELMDKLEHENEIKEKVLTRVIQEFIPICAYCKSIRKGDSWIKIEGFLREISPNLHLSHGICNDCKIKYM